MGITLIDSNGFTNDYIDVDGGTLKYLGKQGVKDTFTVPVWVHKGGWNQQGGMFRLSLSNDSMGDGGTLIVQDASNVVFAGGQKYSVYMTGATSSVQLAHEETLECDDNYYQTDGTLETTDTTTCTLQAGNNKQGTVTIAGGKVKIAQPDTGTYGTLNVNAANLNFAGTYYAAIAGNMPGTNDVLNVSGTTNLQKGFSLYVYVNGGQPVQGSLWTIINDINHNNIQNNIPGGAVPLTTDPQTNLNAGIKTDDNTKFVLSF